MRNSTYGESSFTFVSDVLRSLNETFSGNSVSLASLEYWDEAGQLKSSVISNADGWSIEKQNCEKLIFSVSHAQLGLEFDIELEVSQSLIRLTIPQMSIQEHAPCRLKSITPLVDFLSAVEDDGSMIVLPVNSGVLCHCREKIQAEYPIPVFFPYINDMCSMPIFGIKRNDSKAILAIVDGGAFDLSLLLRTCWGEEQRYSINPIFHVRDYADDSILEENISIRYVLLQDEAADYAGMARYYRNYNLTERKLPTLKGKIEENPDLAYSTKAVSIRCRMAVKQMPTPILEQTPDNQPPMHVYMTFDDVKTVAEEFARQNVGPAEFCLVGWNYGGHDGAFPQLFPVEPNLGGQEKLEELIHRSHKLGYSMSLHDNYFDSYSLAENFDENNIAINHDGKPVLGGQYGGGQAYQVCSRRAYERNALKNIPEVAKLGIKGPYYSDVISVIGLEKCYSAEHPMSRRASAFWWKKIMKFKRQVFGASSSEGARDWALPELDRAYSICGPSKTDQPYADEDVPLYQIVYHGFLIYNSFRGAINTFPGDEKYLLSLAYGSIPVVYYHHIFNPAWDSTMGWANDLTFEGLDKLKKDVAVIKRMTDEVVELSELQTEFIDNFIRHNKTLTETVYADGTSVWVNFGDQPQHTPCGTVVEAKNFTVISPTGPTKKAILSGTDS